ncbi:YihY/virulence factor BrkB family protein [Haloferula sp.]|uniref:YihY/virulence factor BrkB family protein n=1 Tax=Haloferula sp. TaxID=2497595 RepID=UPI003C717B89
MMNRFKAWAMAWWKGWSHYECAGLSAATAYYASVSIIPLMLVLMAAAGWFFSLADHGQDSKERLLEFVSNQISPTFSEALGKLLSDLGDNALMSGPLAGLGLVVSASFVFAQIDRGFGRIWDLGDRAQRAGVLRAAERVALLRLRSLMLVGLASATVLLIFVAGLLIRGAMEIISKYWPQLAHFSTEGTLLLGVLINVFNLSIIYKVLSKGHVRLWPCVQAAMIAAVIWEVGSQTLIALSFGKHYGIYGQVGSILVVLVWLHFTAMVLFAGAIIVRNGSVEKPVIR